MLKNSGCRLITILIFFVFPSTAAFAQNDQPPAALTLDESVSMALKNNNLIRQAKESLSAQEEVEKSARADLLPSVSAGYQYTHLKDAPYMFFQHQTFLIDGDNQFNWNVSLHQPLFTGFALTTRYEMEKLGVDVKSEEDRQARQTVVNAVKKAYFNILLTRQFQKTADEAVTQLSAHSRDADNFYHQGLIPYNDVLKSQVALADARQNLTTANSRVEMAVSGFNILVSLPINHKTEVVEAVSLPPAPAELDPLMAEALKNQPAVQAMQLTQQQADLAVRLARSAYFPGIFLTGFYQQNGQNTDAGDNKYSNWQNTGVSIAAQWDLLTWGKRGSDVRRRMHEREAVAARLHEIEDNVRLEVKQAYLNLTVADENIRTAEKTLDQARENFRITNVQYQENIAASIDVIDARTDLTRAESNYYGALYGYQIAAADLDRAMGRMAQTESEDRAEKTNPLPDRPTDDKP